MFSALGPDCPGDYLLGLPLLVVSLSLTARGFSSGNWIPPSRYPFRSWRTLPFPLPPAKSQGRTLIGLAGSCDIPGPITVV